LLRSPIAVSDPVSLLTLRTSPCLSVSFRRIVGIWRVMRWIRVLRLAKAGLLVAEYADFEARFDLRTSRGDGIVPYYTV